MSAQTPHDCNRPNHGVSETVELPLILTLALAELRQPLPEFLSALVCQPFFRKVRKEPYRLEVDATLSNTGLTAFIWLGPQVRYYWPANSIVLFGAKLPPKQMRVSDVPLSAILWHPLLADDRIMIRKVEPFNRRPTMIGVRLLLNTPCSSFDIYRM